MYFKKLKGYCTSNPS